MSRNDEYKALLQELEHYPPALDGTAKRAQIRNRKQKQRSMLWRFSIPVWGMAACFAFFVLLVNLFPPFAYACGQIPSLKALAQAVAWSPSLSAAVEHEYVQKIEESQTQNGFTATVHYIIGDRRELNIFYSLEYEQTAERQIYAEYQSGKMEGCSMTAGEQIQKPGELRRIDYSFLERDVPESMDLTIEVYSDPWVETEPSLSVENAMFRDPSEGETQPLAAKFTFQLDIDPYFTDKGKVIPVNQRFAVENQTLLLTDVEIYPTCLRVNLRDTEDNRFLLSGMELYLEDELGHRFEKRKNGITSSFSPSSGGEISFWMDSPFFSNSQHLTLYIRQIEWRDKEARRIRVDLKNGVCSELPPNTCFEGAEHDQDGWILTFIHPYKEEKCMYSPFKHSFWGEDGKEYEINTHSSTFGYEDKTTGACVKEDEYFTNRFPLKDFHEDIVYLEADYTHITKPQTPIAIPIQ